MPFVSEDYFKNPSSFGSSMVYDPAEASKNPFRTEYDSDPDIARVQKEQDLMNAWSAEQAFQNRLWQEEMSSTAHQREVADLKAAGLNPVLSANSGASTPAGTSATADSSSVSAIKDIAVTQAEALSAVALMQARGSGSGSSNNLYYGKNAWQKMLEDLIEGYAGTDAQTAMRNLGNAAKNNGIWNTMMSLLGIGKENTNAKSGSNSDSSSQKKKPWYSIFVDGISGASGL